VTYTSQRREGAVTLRFAPIVAALLIAQAIVWVALPLLFDGAIRRDVAEGVIDGPEWRLAYFRHPPFSSWLTGIASSLGPYRYAAVYAIAFALASGAFALIALFLARRDNPRAGLIALIAGLSSPYATYVPLEFNHNIGQMPFWAAILASAWFAFEGGSLAQWALFGAAVGCGLWAKYAVLHLVGPLGLLFLLTPDWRRWLLTPGPWIALAIAAAISAPHFLYAIEEGSTTFQFALRTAPASFGERLMHIGEFTLDIALAQISMALIALAACGRRPLLAALRVAINPRTSDRFDRFLLVAALGPVVVILAAALLSVRPHLGWLTAFTLMFAAWWGHVAARAGIVRPRRAGAVFLALALLQIVAYVGVREIAPRVGLFHPPYPDTDGPRLAALAQDYWRDHAGGPIPYIVTLRAQHGMQAGGSIAFDLPYRVRVLTDGDPAEAPWIDIADLKRRGALIVSPGGLPPGVKVLGEEPVDVVSVERPMRRGATDEPMVFARLPASE
jgi:4-amino-4-deoxy-L-arabinose transferase-like glycosyltransferase